MQDTYQMRVDGLQEQVRLLQQRFVSLICTVSYFTVNGRKLKYNLGATQLLQV